LGGTDVASSRDYACAVTAIVYRGIKAKKVYEEKKVLSRRQPRHDLLCDEQYVYRAEIKLVVEWKRSQTIVSRMYTSVKL